MVWESRDDNDYEISYSDGINIQQLTDNSDSDAYPQIHNGEVVWYGYDGNDFEIFYWDGTSIRQLTDNNYDDYSPQIHNGQVVWAGRTNNDDNDSAEIFYWDGSIIKQLTDNNFGDWDPQIHNGQIVWRGHVGTDREIFFWDGVSESKKGSLLVKIEPEDARSAGAQWRVDNGAWRDSNYAESDLQPGNYSVYFNTVEGWTTPESQVVTITEGDITAATGKYAESGNNGGDGGGGGGCFIGAMPENKANYY